MFFHLRPLETPSVAPELRFTVTRVAIPNCYRLVVRHGYMDEIITPNLAALVCEQIRDFIIRQRVNATIKGDAITSAMHQDNSFEPLGRGEKNLSEAQSVSTSTTEESIAADLAKVEAAFDRQVLYIIGKEQLRVKAGTKLWRKVLLSAFLWIRENTRTKVANLTVDTSKVVEIGFIKDM